MDFLQNHFPIKRQWGGRFFASIIRIIPTVRDESDPGSAERVVIGGSLLVIEWSLMS